VSNWKYQRETLLSLKRQNNVPLARMRVPKMVKNGFNSVLPVYPVFEEDKIPQEIKNRYGVQSPPWIMKGE